jgi:DNA-binding transcriptional ArsR family regulator
MRDDGLLSSRREGTRVYYAIKDRRVIKLLNALKDICTQFIERTSYAKYPTLL